MNTFGLKEEKERCIPEKEWLRQTLNWRHMGTLLKILLMALPVIIDALDDKK